MIASRGFHRRWPEAPAGCHRRVAIILASRFRWLRRRAAVTRRPSAAPGRGALGVRRRRGPREGHGETPLGPWMDWQVSANVYRGLTETSTISGLLALFPS
jgi:hypothetical protein